MPFTIESEPFTAARVLVALARPDFCDRMREALAGQITEVILADSVEAVWREIDGAAIDLAYVDLAEAGLEGCQLIGQLRRHARSRNLPIVALAPHDRVDVLRAALDTGASAFLLHEIDWSILPVHFDYVLRHARKWVREHVKRETAEAKCRARDAFLGGACGESLAVMRQIGELAAKALRARDGEGGTRSLVAGLRAIDSQAVQLDRLIGDAMEAAKELDRSIALAARASLLSLMVTDTLAALASLAAGRNVVVGMSLPRDDVVVTCDDDAMTEALEHLLRNAITHAPAGSRVEVEAKVHADRMLTIAVSDRGHGMSPEFVARCLTPLAADLEYGAPRQLIGRGLPLAKAIAEAHGGTLEIRTNLRAGTMAMIVVPAARVHPATGAHRPQA